MNAIQKIFVILCVAVMLVGFVMIHKIPWLQAYGASFPIGLATVTTVAVLVIASVFGIKLQFGGLQ